MTRPIEVVIVGGGTAGWLTALWIVSLVPESRARVTLVESARIGVIGVGEASTGQLTKLVLDPRFGLSEPEFMRNARATLKLGILHRDWRRLGHRYWGPIDNPSGLSPAIAAGGFPLLQLHAVARERAVADAYLNGRLMQRGRVPVVATSPLEKLPIYAYHIDAPSLARYLARTCVSRGVRHIEGLVLGVARSAAGTIDRLELDAARSVAGDFFIDCSGFARILHTPLSGARFRSWRDELPLDSALPFLCEHPGVGDIPSWTEARALDAGWLWAIPTADRMGCGYVFASEFTTVETARAELARIAPNSCDFQRVLRFEPGRLEHAWRGNSLAVGLAAGFVEPLESTSIHATLLQLEWLVAELSKPDFQPADAVRAERYSRRLGACLDDFKDFVALHYRTERTDTAFWRHMSAKPLSELARSRLDGWQRNMPLPENFESTSGAVSPNLYLPVLDGLGLVSAEGARAALARHGLADAAGSAWRALDPLYNEVVASALTHREALTAMDASARASESEPLCGSAE